MAIQTVPTCRMKWAANKQEMVEQMEPSIEIVQPMNSSALPAFALKAPIVAMEKSIAGNRH